MLAHGSLRIDENQHQHRWFSDDYFDLILWLDRDDAILGFQLCYDKLYQERTLTWTEERGFEHHAVDDGESLPTKNHAPILTADGVFPAGVVRKEFEARSAKLPPEIRELVLRKIMEREEKPSAG